MRNDALEPRHLPRLRKPALLIAATIAVGSLASCGSGNVGSSEDSTAAATAPATTEADANGGSGAARLPDNFPSEFPLPPNLEITQGTFTEGSAMTQGNYLVRGNSEMSVEDIASFYHERLPEAGYDVQQSQPVAAGATSALVYFHGDKFKDASVQLSNSGGATDVTISLPLRD